MAAANPRSSAGHQPKATGCQMETGNCFLNLFSSTPILTCGFQCHVPKVSVSFLCFECSRFLITENTDEDKKFTESVRSCQCTLTTRHELLIGSGLWKLEFGSKVEISDLKFEMWSRTRDLTAVNTICTPKTGSFLPQLHSGDTFCRLGRFCETNGTIFGKSGLFSKKNTTPGFPGQFLGTRTNAKCRGV